MGSANVRAVVFKGTDDVQIIEIDVYDPKPTPPTTTAIAWAGVTRMVLDVMRDAEQDTILATADTDVTATLLDYGTDGQLGLKLGALLDTNGDAIPDGEYKFRVAAYEGAIKKSIIHEDTHDALIRFVSA